MGGCMTLKDTDTFEKVPGSGEKVTPSSRFYRNRNGETYHAEGNRKILRKNAIRSRRFKRFMTCMMVLMLGAYAAVGFFGLKFAGKLLKGMPELDVSDFVSEESSRIYDSSGQFITEIGHLYRENISYEDCPESLIDAFLAIEDSRYFTHNGFDIPRFIKAAVQHVISHGSQGGSTFTMQLVKNTYFSIDDEEGGK